MKVRLGEFLVVTLLVAGCAADGAGTVATTTRAGSDGGTTEATTSPSSSSTVVEAPGALIDVAGVAVVTLNDVTESGPHPTLGWAPVEGAASYWLVVEDADGLPYWAWTGADTSVRVGGGASAEANQTALLHEAMTWSVAAFDESGALIALSEKGTLAP